MSASMRRVDENGRLFSTSEGSLPCLKSAEADSPPLTQSRPLSNIYPLQSLAERSAPSLLSGCVAQVQPVTSGPLSVSRLNGTINSSAWSSPVIGQPDGKTHSSRIMRLFSNPRKGSGPGHNQTADTTHSAQGLHNTTPTQAWTVLPGLGVVDSFKKLRSSVLQGLQNRGTANLDGAQFPISNQEMINSNHNTGNQLSFIEGYSVPNGIIFDQKLAVMTQNGSDHEDYEDEEDVDGEGLHRNTRFSRSIRRAYGAGRISLLDTGQGQTRTGRPVGIQTPTLGSDVDFQTEGRHEDTNVMTEHRLSKSTETLNVFKSPFRCKVSSPGPSSLQQDSPGVSRPIGTSGIQRTASASSVDLRGRSAQRWRSPLRAKGHMLKLVGSMNDLTVRRRQSPSPSPSPSSPVSPLSRLHDDYSRRTPCFPASERQRRPSPARTRAVAERTDRTQSTLEHATVSHPQPDSEASPVKHQVLISPIQMRLSDQTEETLPGISFHYDPQSATSTCSHTVEAVETGRDLPPLSQEEPPGSEEQTSQPKEAPPDQQVREALLQQEDASPTASGSNPLSPAGLSESPRTPTGEDSNTLPETTTPSINPRRRAGRARPRPISDYGQLVSRKYPIPEEKVELHSDGRSSNGTSRQDSTSSDKFESSDSPGSCSVNGDILGRKQRPISVIGVAELFSSPGADDKEIRLPSPLSRPPVPSHDVPPYRAVSARFRPSTLSQSTPIGLDRLGRRKLHRVLSDGVSEASAVLDDSVSEEDGSFDELSDVTPYLQPGVELSLLNEWISSGHTVYAEALWDHVTMEEQELAFKAEDVIRVLDASHKDWWWGRGADKEAWFPSSFVRVRVNQEDSSSESVESMAGQEHPAPRDTQSVQHREQMRTNVVQEIMKTERIYIKHLRDICEGYIRQCRKHPTMFTELQLKTIFSNIEDIYLFQRQFLRDLEKKYNKDQPHLSKIGSCFLLQGEGFSIYSDYCNTHPAACAELQRLMKLGRYKHFFEACRLLQQMIDISIAGFLLTPVQKICKYPLQLGELLKYTPKDHSDYSGVSDAYEAMKNVASLINERKRRLESVDAIAHWQVAILHWEGADVLERSSELIHSGELTRIVRQGKTQHRSFFLFDHQLIFCKKDVLRRDLLHYRGRLDMDQTEVLELPDGRDLELGLTLRNALRLQHASTSESVCVLCCRKAQDKQRWLQAFVRERRRVQEDQEMGMEISEEQRKQALFNARKVKQGKIKAIGFSNSPRHQNLHQNLHPLHQRHVTVPTSVPQQQVFSLAEPPKRKPSHLWFSISRSTLFKK